MCVCVCVCVCVCGPHEAAKILADLSGEEDDRVDAGKLLEEHEADANDHGLLCAALEEVAERASGVLWWGVRVSTCGRRTEGRWTPHRRVGLHGKLNLLELGDHVNVRTAQALEGADGWPMHRVVSGEERERGKRRMVWVCLQKTQRTFIALARGDERAWGGGDEKREDGKCSGRNCA